MSALGAGSEGSNKCIFEISYYVSEPKFSIVSKLIFYRSYSLVFNCQQREQHTVPFFKCHSNILWDWNKIFWIIWRHFKTCLRFLRFWNSVEWARSFFGDMYGHLLLLKIMPMCPLSSFCHCWAAKCTSATLAGDCCLCFEGTVIQIKLLELPGLSVFLQLQCLDWAFLGILVGF